MKGVCSLRGGLRSASRRACGQLPDPLPLAESATYLPGFHIRHPACL